MSSIMLNQKIHNFMQRKTAEFPELASSDRLQSQRTIKYASDLRQSGQLLLR